MFLLDKSVYKLIIKIKIFLSILFYLLHSNLETIVIQFFTGLSDSRGRILSLIKPKEISLSLKAMKITDCLFNIHSCGSILKPVIGWHISTNQKHFFEWLME
jgi:hypothetical protein